MTDDDGIYDDIVDDFSWDEYGGVSGDQQARLREFFTQGHADDISSKTEKLVDRLIEIHYTKLDSEQVNYSAIGNSTLESRIKSNTLSKFREEVVDKVTVGKTTIREVKSLRYKDRELNDIKEDQAYNVAAEEIRIRRDKGDRESLNNLKDEVSGLRDENQIIREIDDAIRQIDLGRYPR